MTEDQKPEVLRLLEHPLTKEYGLWVTTLQLYGVTNTAGTVVAVDSGGVRIHKIAVRARKIHEDQRVSYWQECQMAATMIREGKWP